LSNLARRYAIKFSEMLPGLIRRARKPVRYFRPVALALLCLFPALYACADSPGSKSPVSEPASGNVITEPTKPELVRPSMATATPPTIVIGFLGGYVRHDDAVHSTVQVARSLQKSYPTGVHVETFENKRMWDAHTLILRLLSGGDAAPTNQQKQAARIILYGHSWGANAVVALARSLKADGIPVLLTIQVDSVAKAGQDDSVIPDNVRDAINFYQDQGFLHGQEKIIAANPSRTQILGNFREDYSANPISCPQYPWYTRVFMRTHIEIECDQRVWHRVEDLIREKLPASMAGPAAALPAGAQ
jgi:hypothetical protein